MSNTGSFFRWLIVLASFRVLVDAEESMPSRHGDRQNLRGNLGRELKRSRAPCPYQSVSSTTESSTVFGYEESNMRRDETVVPKPRRPKKKRRRPSLSTRPVAAASLEESATKTDPSEESITAPPEATKPTRPLFAHTSSTKASRRRRPLFGTGRPATGTRTPKISSPSNLIPGGRIPVVGGGSAGGGTIFEAVDPPSPPPTRHPTTSPTEFPTDSPVSSQSVSPTKSPYHSPMSSPTALPSHSPTSSPTKAPSHSPTSSLPTKSPSRSPMESTVSPTYAPIHSPTLSPTVKPSTSPTRSPSRSPTSSPTSAPVPSSGFSITLMNMGTVTTWDRAMEIAARRWESVIRNDLPDVAANPFSTSGLFLSRFPGSESVNVDVDDVLIGYRFEPMDFRGGILGAAGPTRVRMDDQGRPISTIAGTMRFDTFDFDPRFMSMRDAVLICMHEMGHVLGLGTMWASKCGVHCGKPGADSRAFIYTCPNANRAYRDLNIPGGTPYLQLEDVAHVGSRCGHFEADSFPDPSWSDIMTYRFQAGKRQLLTTVDIGALEDLGGYEVDYSAADNVEEEDLFAPSFLRGEAAPNDDPLQRPIHPSTSFSLDGRMEELDEDYTVPYNS